ncbi:hypothetical protein BJ165DRAFT_1535575 [Panaeolus papilionaceus]|nr:hypothetical protein BJ165DRAFT_1535575 [Panaeolus papilionaceus]
MQLPNVTPNTSKDTENIPPATTFGKRRSSHKRGAPFIGLGRVSQTEEQKRKREDAHTAASIHSTRPVKSRKIIRLSYEYERPANLSSSIDRGNSQDNAIVIPASPGESPGRDFFETPLPYIPEALPSLPPPSHSYPDNSPLPNPHLNLTDAQRRQKLYEFGRAPQSLPRKSTHQATAATRKKTNIINPFLPRYHKVDGKRVRIVSDGSDVENPNSTRNLKRRRFYRAVILQQMMFHRLFPPVQAELMRRPMKAVLKELADITQRREYIQLYVLPHIHGRQFRPVLNHIIAVRGRLPRDFQTEPVEGPSTFWFLLYTSFAEWDRQRIH